MYIKALKESVRTYIKLQIYIDASLLAYTLANNYWNTQTMKGFVNLIFFIALLTFPTLPLYFIYYIKKNSRKKLIKVFY